MFPPEHRLARRAPTGLLRLHSHRAWNGCFMVFIGALSDRSGKKPKELQKNL
jgi:hypothetical protein